MVTRSLCCGPCPTESARRRSSIRSTGARSTRLQYGNEGARQKPRCALPAMSDSYIEQCCRDIARVLRPSGYLFLWADAFRLCRGDHLQVADVLPCVDLIAWDNGRFGMGYRSRRCGDYLLILQKPPLLAKATWRDHGIRDRLGRKGRYPNSSAHQAGRPDPPADRRRHRAGRSHHRSGGRQLSSSCISRMNSVAALAAAISVRPLELAAE